MWTHMMVYIRMIVYIYVYIQIKIYVTDLHEVELAKLDFLLTLPAPSYTEDKTFRQEATH